jgi:hypothetical protein
VTPAEAIQGARLHAAAKSRKRRERIATAVYAALIGKGEGEERSLHYLAEDALHAADVLIQELDK